MNIEREKARPAKRARRRSPAPSTAVTSRMSTAKAQGLIASTAAATTTAEKVSVTTGGGPEIRASGDGHAAARHALMCAVSSGSISSE